MVFLRYLELIGAQWTFFSHCTLFNLALRAVFLMVISLINQNLTSRNHANHPKRTATPLGDRSHSCGYQLAYFIRKQSNDLDRVLRMASCQFDRVVPRSVGSVWCLRSESRMHDPLKISKAPVTPVAAGSDPLVIDRDWPLVVKVQELFRAYSRLLRLR